MINIIMAIHKMSGDFGCRPVNEHVDVLLVRSYVLGRYNINNRSIVIAYPGLVPISLPSQIRLMSTKGLLCDSINLKSKVNIKVLMCMNLLNF